MTRTNRNRVALVTLGLTLAIVPSSRPASAQSTVDRTGSATDAGVASTREVREDRGFNPGWLGLIGLAGLAGLMPRKAPPAVVHRSGETTSR